MTGELCGWERGWRILGATVLPFLVLSVYLCFSRWPQSWFTSTTDYLALGISMVLGLAALLGLLRRGKARLVATCTYVPVMGVTLIGYTFQFEWMVFGAWL